MREYRKTHKQTPEQKIKENEYRKILREKQLISNPEQIEKGRARRCERMRVLRLDPEVRKLGYKRHTEWARRNKKVVNAKQREYAQKPEYKLVARKNNLKKYYGLTYEEYIQKIESQGNKCAICSNIMENAYVDHNHATGQVRDLLCAKCNLCLGTIEKSPYLITSMTDYLDKWNLFQKQDISISQIA